MNNLSQELLAQLYGQQSDDPFLILFTISHDDFDTVRLVNNTTNITSNGEEFLAFPVQVKLPPDDGETQRTAEVEFSNVSLELIDEFRGVTSPMDIRMDMILASDPDTIQMSFEDLKLRSIHYDKNAIRAQLVVDNFLTVGVTSERYEPHNFPGMF